MISDSDSTTKLQESLKLWKILTELDCFSPTPFMLVLTKADLFQEKIEKVPLQNIFPDFESVTSSSVYSEMSVYEKSWQYILHLFRQRFNGYTFYPYIGNLLETDFCRKLVPTMCDLMCKETFKQMMSCQSGRVGRRRGSNLI